MRTLRLRFPALASSGAVQILCASFLLLDIDDFDAPFGDDPMPVSITSNGCQFEPTEDGTYRARGGGPALRACDPRYRWPQLQRLAQLALGSTTH